MNNGGNPNPSFEDALEAATGIRPGTTPDNALAQNLTWDQALEAATGFKPQVSAEAPQASVRGLPAVDLAAALVA